jgi:glycerophosphoryl diester phosphodiesterase
MLYHGRLGAGILAGALLLAGAPAASFDLQGHRGARGLAPENTLAAFGAALAVGVTTLELDLGVTADDVLVVLHDPYLSPAIARGPDGAWLRAPTPRVRDLTLAELRRYDVGRIDPASAYARRWPGQQPVDGERIPTLAEVVALAAARGADGVALNVETKLSPETPDATVPPERFAALLVDELRRLGVTARTLVQSFDWRTLREVRRRAPEIATACLTVRQDWLDNLVPAWTAGLDLAEHGASVPAMVAAAGCAVWSPFVGDLHALALHEAKALGLKVIPWTVNEPDVMLRLIDAGVDGIITDYPDRLRAIMAEKGLPLPPRHPGR